MEKDAASYGKAAEASASKQPPEDRREEIIPQ
jgi:hypothetical protein